MSYTIYVLDSDQDDAPLLASRTVRGDGTTVVEFGEMPIPGGGQSVCVYATSSAGAHIFDRVPAEGCVNLDEDQPTDYGFHP